MQRSLALVFLLLTPVAGFTSAADTPAFTVTTTDPRGDAAPDLGFNDMLSAGFSYDAGVLTVHATLAAWVDTETSTCWNLDFFVNDRPFDLFAVVYGPGAGEPYATTPGIPVGTYRATGSMDSYVVRGDVHHGDTVTLAFPLGPHIVQVAPGDVVQFRAVQSCSLGFNQIVYDVVDNGDALTLQGAAQPPFINAPSSYSGHFLLGDITLEGGACELEVMEDVNSSCITLADSDLGNLFTVAIEGAAGESLVPVPCFFDADRYLLMCNSVSRIPDEARYLAVSGWGDVAATWHVTTTP